MEELKPCPFCGGEAERTFWFGIKQEAIEAWNKRAERTCHREILRRGLNYDVFYFDCCDEEFAENRNDPYASKISGEFCPYCGAKVVEDAY